jgi:hypothetical protein
MIDDLLLAATRVLTFGDQQLLTNASGFFFVRGGRLLLVTSRHVVLDEPSNHRPDRLVVEMHVDADDMARSIEVSVPLYIDGMAAWREGDAARAGRRRSRGNPARRRAGVGSLPRLHA